MGYRYQLHEGEKLKKWSRTPGESLGIPEFLIGTVIIAQSSLSLLFWRD